jgi:hypothetical protein
MPIYQIDPVKNISASFFVNPILDKPVRSPKHRHPGEGRGPDAFDLTGFRPSTE